MKRILRYFGSGLLFLVPIAVTIFVVYKVFDLVDEGIREAVKSMADKGSAWAQEPPQWVTLVGVLAVLAMITLIGFLSSLFITRPIMQLIERVFSRVPLVKLLYTSLKDLIGAFVGDQKKFDKPVLVDLTGVGGASAVGFITRQSLECLGLDDRIAVYFPQAYNFAGNVMIVRREQVQPLEIDSSDVMAFVVSGGVAGGHGKPHDKGGA